MIADEVWDLVDEGLINKGQANRIGGQAQRPLARAWLKVKLPMLSTSSRRSRSRVLALVKSGQISAEQGDALIASAEEAIELATG